MFALHAVVNIANALALSTGTPSPSEYAAPAEAHAFGSFSEQPFSCAPIAAALSPRSQYILATVAHAVAVPEEHAVAHALSAPGVQATGCLGAGVAEQAASESARAAPRSVRVI